MLDYIKRLFLFLFPILRTAIFQVAADEMSRAAYPNRRPRTYTRYDRRLGFDYYGGARVPFSRPAVDNRFDSLDELREHMTRKPDNKPGFHDVLMVAFDLTGPNAGVVHEWLHNQMPKTGDHLARGKNDETVKVNLDAWWVANDERFDGSDCDSAVFVPMGDQVAARGVLRRAGFGIGR